MRIAWSRLALADREAIFDYIETEQPRAAVIVDARIGAKIKLLEMFPQSGRRGRVTGTRELVIGGTPYIAVYRVVADEVVILRVLHSARQWPERG